MTKQTIKMPIRTKVLIAMVKQMFRPFLAWQPEQSAAHGQNIKISSRDRSNLEAHWQMTELEPCHGIVILCHPFLKYGLHYYLRNGLAQALVGRGFHVLGFNFKGFGLSHFKGAKFSDDVGGAVDWVKLRSPELPVFLLGSSFGGFHAAHALAKGLDGMVSAAVFDSVPPQVSNFFKSGVAGVAMRFLSRSRWREESGTENLHDAWPLIKTTPTLLIYGALDRYMGAEDFHRLKAQSHLKLKIYAHSDHLEVYKHMPDEFVELVANFFGKPSIISNKGDL